MGDRIDLPETYRALVIRKTPEGYDRSVERLRTDDLSPDGVLIRVSYSSLNYKDALSATGRPGITDRYPHTPGIDAAGRIVRSGTGRFREGQEVLVTSYDLGMNTPGGFGEYISVPADWIVPLPEGLSLRESMIIGTAGFTAASGIRKIIDGGVSPDDGPVVVTGATGGVGSFAVTLLAQLGYHVVAVTGKSAQYDFLLELGASKIADREMVTDRSNKQLLKGTWAAAVDVTGGIMLDTIIRQTRQNGIVTCCGNILGHTLRTSIYPFILRGVSLRGIDSGITPMAERSEIWKKLAEEWKPEKLDRLYREVSLDQLSGELDAILEGGITGRVVVGLGPDSG